jgi:hypothetical protein
VLRNARPVRALPGGGEPGEGIGALSTPRPTIIHARENKGLAMTLIATRHDRCHLGPRVPAGNDAPKFQSEQPVIPQQQYIPEAVQDAQQQYVPYQQQVCARAALPPVGCE